MYSYIIPDGQYGYNCQEKCNVNCGVPYKFDKITSLCKEGCQVGWKGITCNESKSLSTKSVFKP